MNQRKERKHIQQNAVVAGRFPIRPRELDRFKSGKKLYYQVAASKKGKQPLCLDIACGAKPFPKANVLCDLNAKPVEDRSMMDLVTEEKPFVCCSCYNLPFKDEAFDFVTCYYLLEHLTDPWSFFEELKRVSKHGFLQCPTWFNELLYGENVHNWTVLKRGNKLFVKALNEGALPPIRFGFVFHRLYRFKTWRIIHALLDELFHLFAVRYDF